MIDKSALKKTIDATKPSEILVLTVNKVEKNSLQMCQKEIEKFIKKQEDYVIAVMRR
jgi:hypothetical protein